MSGFLLRQFNPAYDLIANLRSAFDDWFSFGDCFTFCFALYTLEFSSAINSLRSGSNFRVSGKLPDDKIAIWPHSFVKPIPAPLTTHSLLDSNLIKGIIIEKLLLIHAPNDTLPLKTPNIYF